jgi:hypothetical protein
MQRLSAAAGIALPMHAPPERSTRTRNSRRALRWREQLERVAGHAMAQARTQAQRDEVGEAHAEAVAHGPDWARIRRGSDFARPVAVKDRNALDRLLRWFARLERETWQADRAWARHEQRTIRRSIPRTARAVLLALVALSRKYQVVHPSIARLGSMAQCCRSTVVAALDVLEGLGVVTRHRRRKVVQTSFGPRVAQDCSAYVICAPDGCLEDRPRPARSRPQVQSVNSRQRLELQGQQSTGVRVAQAESPPKPPNATLPMADHDWRARARAALDAQVAAWRR